MNIGEKFYYGDRKVKYTLLDILPKHKTEFDMFLCLHEASGTKECFQRQDIESTTLTVCRSRRDKHVDTYPWTSEDIAELKKFAKTRTIHTKFIPIGNHTVRATELQYRKMKKRGDFDE